MIGRLTELLKQSNFDAIAINAGPDMSAITGLDFHLSERPVVLFFSPGIIPVLVCPEFEFEKTKKSHIPLEVFSYPEETEKWVNCFKNAINRLNLNKSSIVVSPTSFRMLEYSLCKLAAEGCHIVPDANLFGTLRLRKTFQEVQRIRKAVEIAEQALINTIPEICVGVTEKFIATRLTMNLFLYGSDPDLPFSPIVASGENSANPHATPSEKPIQEGDALIIDWGARYEGYISDLTRSFFVRNSNTDLQNIAVVVEKANEAAREACQSGITSGEIDAAARTVIDDAGYGQYFIHRTGHGIGLEVHEEPYIQKDVSTTIEPGMVFTIEPGIYIPGVGGIRIEDNIVVNDKTCDTLTTLPRKVRFID